MANEKRLIDANALKSCLCKCCNILHSEEPCEPSECNVMDFVDSQPTVDAVEVVRCKDCTQWCRNIGIADSPNGHCFNHDIDTNGHDFCSYGERKDNG